MNCNGILNFKIFPTGQYTKFNLTKVLDKRNLKELFPFLLKGTVKEK